MQSAFHILTICAFCATLGACERTHTTPPLPSIDWRTSPLNLNLRGMNGKSYLFRCPAGKPAPESVTGSGVYTDASSICAAAAHAGAIDTQRGGLVMIQILCRALEPTIQQRRNIMSQPRSMRRKTICSASPVCAARP